MPREDDYCMLIEREWADIHHSRVQEWSALGVVAGAHIGLIQLAKFAIENSDKFTGSALLLAAPFIGAFFCVLGILMTFRHRHLMQTKLQIIFAAEEKLGLVQAPDNTAGVIPEKFRTKRRWQIDQLRMAFPRFLSTSFLIFCFYLAFFLLDVFLAVHYK